MSKKPNKALSTKIAIIGAGPVGRITALKLHAIGADIILIGPAPREDYRTTALMQGSLILLETLGLKQDLESQSAPLRTMRIIDGTKRLIRSSPVSFQAGEISEDYFGLNIPNNHLNQVLAEAVKNAKIPHLESLATNFDHHNDHIIINLEDGTQISTQLLVGADGRLSKVRDFAGINVRPKALPQAAFVLTFTHERPHLDISTEFHTEHGPFTQVPLPMRDGKHRSSLVWVTNHTHAEELQAMNEAALNCAIEQKMQSILGKTFIDGPSQTFPLHMSLPSAAAQNRCALVGEAAHAMPPIGAQGMNLSLRDVAELAKIVQKAPDDAGRADIMDNYSRNRRMDILARINAVGALNASLLSDMLPAQMARAGGLGLMSASAGVRNFFMREGMKPGSGIWQLFASTRRK